MLMAPQPPDWLLRRWGALVTAAEHLCSGAPWTPPALSAWPPTHCTAAHTFLARSAARGRLANGTGPRGRDQVVICLWVPMALGLLLPLGSGAKSASREAPRGWWRGGAAAAELAATPVSEPGQLGGPWSQMGCGLISHWVPWTVLGGWVGLLGTGQRFWWGF